MKWAYKVVMSIRCSNNYSIHDQVKYHNLSDALSLAHAEDKLVHSIILWGALDDQSCWGSARTLRNSALQGRGVMELLNQHFISTWSLMVDLKVSLVSVCMMCVCVYNACSGEIQGRNYDYNTGRCRSLNNIPLL